MGRDFGPTEAGLSRLMSEDAGRALRLACRQVGIDPRDAGLIRIGSNAVYRLRDRVIARVAPADRSAVESAQRQVAVARWLASVDYPAARATDLAQPVNVERHVVTFWDSVSDREEYATVPQVADLFRRLHELTVPESLTLPDLKPFEQARTAIDQVAAIPIADVDYLAARLTELTVEYDGLEFALPSGPIHGDANVGNVILDREGDAVLIDLDSFCIGPREWDLVQTALFYERFGWHTLSEYQKFAEVYGFDVMSWPGYPVLAGAREILMTLWLGRMAGANERAVSEARKRVDAIRAGKSRRDWSPF